MCFETNKPFYHRQKKCVGTMENIHIFHTSFHIVASKVLPVLLTMLMVTHVSCH